MASSFPPDLGLAGGQAYLSTAVETSAASAADNEARIYSAVQLFAAPDVTTLPTADYTGVTLGDYQTFLDGQVSTMQAEIAAITDVNYLYDYDPAVDTVP